jgi:hypothetical protein
MTPRPEVLFGPSPPQTESVTRLGNLRWAELQVFAVVGSWVAVTPDSEASESQASGHEVRVALSGMSRHAAWRARMLGDRLPVVGALAADVVTVARHDDLAAVVAQMAAVAATADRLAVLGEVVLSGLVSSSAALLDTLSPVADAPAMRILPMLIDDLNRDRAVVASLMAQLGMGSGGPVTAQLADALGDAGGW